MKSLRTFNSPIANPLLNTVEILLEVGEMLLFNWNRCQIDHFKQSHDICTNLDLKAEEMIIGYLEKKYPNHTILSEEKGLIGKQSSYRWVIDPIDGSKNFLRKLPFFNITIALQENKKTIFGIIYSPATRELFYAIEKQGSYFVPVTNNFIFASNHQKLVVTNKKQLNQATMHIEFPTLQKTPDQKYNIPMINKFFRDCYRLRSIGSGALAFAYTAIGAYDGYIDFSRTANIWDVAAGILMVEEAGGMVSDFEGKLFSDTSTSLIATNCHLHKQILELLRK